MSRVLVIIAVVLVIALAQGGGGVLPTTKITDVVYVYEQREHPVPSGVMSGMNRLNREKNVVATFFDKDTKNAAGETPKQYVVPLAAAKDAGLPSLIVVAGDKAVKVVKDPKTEAQVVGAVQ